uniref:Chromo domain-containing protein n=1 Tax=Steinernema glaseri TaxID=37863 RepID=A0A1I7Z4X3_9BILA
MSGEVNGTVPTEMDQVAETSVPPELSNEETLINDIDEIVSERMVDGQLLYEVRWKMTFENTDKLRQQAPQAVKDFELYKQMGRVITINNYIEPDTAGVQVTADDVANVHYNVTYKGGHKTIVTHKFLEKYYARELIQFLLPVLAESV